MTHHTLEQLVLGFLDLLYNIFLGNLFQLHLSQFNFLKVLNILDQEYLIGEEQHFLLVTVLTHIRYVQIGVKRRTGATRYVLASSLYCIFDPHLCLVRRVTESRLALIGARGQRGKEDKSTDGVGSELHPGDLCVPVVLMATCDTANWLRAYNLLLIILKHQVNKVSHPRYGYRISRRHDLIHNCIQLVRVLLDQVVQQILIGLVPLEFGDLNEGKLADLFHLFAHNLNELLL